MSTHWGDWSWDSSVCPRWPEALEHARGDALPSHHADHPDAADATDGWLRRGGAAPGSLPLEHHLLSLGAVRDGLLDHPVALWGRHATSVPRLVSQHFYRPTDFLSDPRLTSCMCSAMRQPPTFLSLEMKRKVLVWEGHLVSTCWKPRSLSTTSLISSTWGTNSYLRKVCPRQMCL